MRCAAAINHKKNPFSFREFTDLGKWERKLIEGPYIHHMSEIEGSFTAEIKEFCKYVPKLSFDTVE